MLAYADDTGIIHLVGPQDGAELRILKLSQTDYSVLKFSSDSKYLAGGGTSGDNVHVCVWDLKNGDSVRRWDWPKGRDPHSDVECICFRPDGKQLAAAVFRQSAAYLYDLTTGGQVAKLEHNQVYGLSFSPDNETLATAGWDRNIRFWKTSTGEIQRQFDVNEGRENDGDQRMYTVCYAGTGALLASAHLDGKVRIWNAADMALRKEFQVNGRFIYGSICFSPDGAFLATGSMSGEIALWDPLAAEVMLEVGRHEHYAYTVAFGKDSRTLVSGGPDGVCYQWDLQPRGQPPEQDLKLLWKDLAGDGPTAYRSMWGMKQAPARTVAFLGDKLRPVTIVMNLDRIEAGLSAEEAKDRERLARDLMDKDEKVVLSRVARRAIATLRLIGTPDAIAILKELAERDPKAILGKMAAAALEQPATAK